MMNSAVPVFLAWRASCAAHSRTCATDPGAEVSASEYSVWIESITATSGRAASSAARMRSSWISASSSTFSATSARRVARSATCSADSSPLT